MFHALTYFCACLVLGITSGDEPDYYWREYTGIIPNDAFPATIHDEVKTYIGNVVVDDDGLYVGELFGGIRNISAYAAPPIDALYQRNTIIKILCTRHPENFQWVDVTALSIHSIPRKLIIGGYSSFDSIEIYIGRARTEEGIGNVYSNSTNINYLYYYNTNTGLHSNFEYEILTYKETQMVL